MLVSRVVMGNSPSAIIGKALLEQSPKNPESNKQLCEIG